MPVLAAVNMLLVLQATQPTVAGTIRDGESGKPLAQAIVALADLDRSMLSDTSGRYRFLSVPPGPQHLTARAQRVVTRRHSAGSIRETPPA
jgi:protocatechuate 3,4-dioxygenase beta subunit